ncbi:hypothetical protein [Roseivivax sp. CAU 1753]
MNRQQFEKYLSGRSFPTLSARHRLAEYFGIDIHALTQRPDQFAAAYRNTDAPKAQSGFTLAGSTDAELAVLKTYVGAFQCFFLNPAWPDRIHVGLIFIREDGRQVHTVYFNRTRDPETGDLHRSRLDGRLMMRGERLFLLEKTRVTEERLSETIMFPSHGPGSKYLTGMLFGVTWRPHRMPFASRTIWRRASPRRTVKSLMRDCGVHALGDREIDPIVRKFFETDLKAYSMSVF